MHVGRRDHHASTAVDVADTRELVRRWPTPPIGKAVPVVVLRDGKTETLTITLGRREEAEAEAVPAAADPRAEARQSGTAGPDRDAADDEIGASSWACPPAPKGWWSSSVDRRPRPMPRVCAKAT